MIAAIGPANYNYEETLSTLRYANRAKSIKNAPKINENPKDAKLREMQDEIELLRKQLQEAMGSDFKIDNNFMQMMTGGNGEDDDKYGELDEKLQKEQEAIEAKLEKQRANIMANK